MKIAALGCTPEEKECIKKVFPANVKNYELCFLPADISTQGAFRASEYNFIITFNLAGFELKTLTNNLWYNLLPCKQVHIITDLNSKQIPYLSKPLSISMFFFCETEVQKNTLTARYENIPWIKVLDSTLTSFSERIQKAFLEVVSECTD